MKSITNAGIAELLSRETEREGHTDRRARALRRAARAALTWPREAAGLAEEGRLTELRAVGPWIAGIVEDLLDAEVEPPAPPAERAGFLTTAEARAVLAEDPSWRASLRGDHQMHTTWSDGRATLEEMVEAARALGREHVVVTDHSSGLPIAKGMSDDRLLEQGGAIAALGDPGIRVLRGVEMNLSLEGEPDVPPDVLARLDLALGSFHSKLRLTDDQTDRYLAAVRHPGVDVLAHPRGRRYGSRVGLTADWPRVLAAAAASGTAVEGNAHPDRQDLDVRLLEVARDAGAWVSVGTDAHRVEELEHVELALAALALARFPKDRVLNFLPAEEVRAWAGRG